MASELTASTDRQGTVGRLLQRLEAWAPRRWETVVLWVGWTAAALVLFGAAPLVMSVASCGRPDGSANYGELTWTAVPPGPTCTWTEATNGFDGEERILSYTFAVVGWVAAAPVLAFWFGHPKAPGTRFMARAPVPT